MKLKKIAKRYPHLRKSYTELLEKLSNNPFDPSMHTHPLKGKLKGKYAGGSLQRTGL
ncbi:MAG: plasmid stabilization protein [Nitrospinae bacterium]|nr:plasmid stabilization protein [Nitrospinota bacterium]